MIIFGCSASEKQLSNGVERSGIGTMQISKLRDLACVSLQEGTQHVVNHEAIF